MLYANLSFDKDVSIYSDARYISFFFLFFYINSATLFKRVFTSKKEFSNVFNLMDF